MALGNLPYDRIGLNDDSFFFFPVKDFQLLMKTGLSLGCWGRAQMASVAGDTSGFFACQPRVMLTQLLRQTYIEHMSTFIYSFNEVIRR